MEFEPTQEYLEYINSILISDGKRKDKINNTLHNRQCLSYDTLCEVYGLYEVLEMLEYKKITTHNYTKKVGDYFDTKKWLYLEYGIEIPSYYPFPNPSDIIYKIDILLHNNGLNTEQRRDFYKETKMRCRLPRKDKVEKVLEQIRQNEHMKSVFERFVDLDIDELDTLIQEYGNENFSSDEEPQELAETYHLSDFDAEEQIKISINLKLQQFMASKKKL